MAYYTTCTSAGTVSAWPTWIQSNYASAATSSNVWVTWVTTGSGTVTEFFQPQGGWQAPVPTPEQQAAQAAAQAAEQERYAEAERQRLAAKTKARQLLEALLNPEQHEEFLRKNCFTVCGQSGQQYRIRAGRIAGNIDVLNGDKVAHRLCCHLGDYGVPEEDHLVAQLLHLRHDEAAFLQTAHRHAALT